MQNKALRMSYYFAIYVLGYWLISSWFAVHVHGSLTPAFVAIWLMAKLAGVVLNTSLMGPQQYSTYHPHHNESWERPAWVWHDADSLSWSSIQTYFRIVRWHHVCHQHSVQNVVVAMVTEHSVIWSTVEPPLFGLQTYGHLLLRGTIFSHTKLISCPKSAEGAGQGWVTCVNSVFSMQPVFAQSALSSFIPSLRMLSG